MRAEPAVVGGRRIAASILTWRGYDASRACLSSLGLLDGRPIPTLVVDSASGTGEGVRLAAEFGPPVEALELPENGGVPSGYNAAIRWAAERGADYVLLMNNDTIITDPAMVTRLVEAMQDDVAVVGPIVRDPDGSVFSAGGILDWRLGRSRHRKTPLRGDEPYEAAWLDGPALLLSLEAVKHIGGLAPEYFMYWEEVDWCVRATRAGYRCLVQPATSIVHLRASGDPSPRIRYLMMRNRILFMRRNGSTTENVTSLAVTLGYRIPALLARGLRRPRRLPAFTSAAVRSIGWNISDAARRRSWRRAAGGPPVTT